MKSGKFSPMRVKTWTHSEVRELVTMAKAAGFPQSKVAEYVGCTVASLQIWMQEGQRNPKGGYRRALTLAEFWIGNEITPIIEDE